MLLLNIDQKLALDRLPIAEGASFDSLAEEHNATCLPDTRVEVLDQISAWAHNPAAKAVFWLNGMAGTGKSTISRTIAQSFAGTGHLAATFFFKRGGGDRGSLAKFFTTVAADLVVRKPATAPHVKNALDADSSIVTKNAGEQFEKLFQQPLLKAASIMRKDTVVVVVDALDECASDEDIKLLIRLLSRSNSGPNTRLKVFLTSRPELPSRIGFRAIEGTYQDIILHEMPQLVVEHDICTFLKCELARIRDDYNTSVSDDLQCPPEWPNQSDITTLAKMAVPLFIFAATICRFVADRKYGNPEKQLLKVLNYKTKSHKSALAETYLLVLNQQVIGFDEQEKKEALEEFRDIVGPIILLAAPLSISALAQILGVSGRDINDRLALLHSVISVPQAKGSGIHLLHLSFRDFLVNSDVRETNPFWIDEKHVHEAMATNCLRLLRGLKRDLCDVKTPGTRRSDIKAEIISTHLPSEMQYACLYWVHHLQQAGSSAVDGGPAHGFLKQHLLHWMEALSLIGRVSEGLDLIKMLESLLKVSQSPTG